MRRLVGNAWFENKDVGWGLAPARWEGWAVTAGFVLVMTATLLAPILMGRHWRMASYLPYIGLAAVEVLAFITVSILTSVWLKPR